MGGGEGLIERGLFFNFDLKGRGLLERGLDREGKAKLGFYGRSPIHTKTATNCDDRG